MLSADGRWDGAARQARGARARVTGIQWRGSAPLRPVELARGWRRRRKFSGGRRCSATARGAAALSLQARRDGGRGGISISAFVEPANAEGYCLSALSSRLTRSKRRVERRQPPGSAKPGTSPRENPEPRGLSSWTHRCCRRTTAPPCPAGAAPPRATRGSGRCSPTTSAPPRTPSRSGALRGGRARPRRRARRRPSSWRAERSAPAPGAAAAAERGFFVRRTWTGRSAR